MSVTADSLKRSACDAIDRAAADLHRVSQDIWSHPEVNYKEVYAHQVLTDFLEKYKFPVERHYVTDTGFRSVYGRNDKPNVSVLCEYDALPEIGHGCGHNLIAEVGVGAAIGIKAALDAAKNAGKELGLLTVLGTPAEEGGGGKIDMINAGSFTPLDVSMMAHPFPITTPTMGLIAVDMVTVTYHGKASHAAGFPWEGVNALDAAVMAYNSISVMRQQMKPTWRIHGIISNGGAKPNIIPELTKLEFYARCPTKGELKKLKAKAIACFEAAATSTGCTVQMEWTKKPYDNVMSNQTLASLFEANGKAVGVDFETDQNKVEQLASGSTDFGNVSHVVPSIHPMFYIGGDVFNHTRQFTEIAGDAKAQPYTLAQAKAMAMTAIDIYCQPHLVDKIKAEFTEDLRKEEDI